MDEKKGKEKATDLLADLTDIRIANPEITFFKPKFKPFTNLGPKKDDPNDLRKCTWCNRILQAKNMAPDSVVCKLCSLKTMIP